MRNTSFQAAKRRNLLDLDLLPIVSRGSHEWCKQLGEDLKHRDNHQDKWRRLCLLYTPSIYININQTSLSN